MALLAVLLVLKPLVTAACLGSGAPGGLFTPTLAYGVLLGGLLGKGWAQLWPGAPLGGYAIIGGAAVLAASMQGPLAAVVLLLELTHRARRADRAGADRGRGGDGAHARARRAVDLLRAAVRHARGGSGTAAGRGLAGLVDGTGSW